MMELHSAYRQPTIFDQLWLALAHGLRSPAWLRGRRAWGWTFAALALLFGAIAAAFLLSILHPAGTGSALASLGSALLSLGVFRHFARCALPLLRAGAERRPAPLHRAKMRDSGRAPAPAPRRVPQPVPEVQPAPPSPTVARRAYLFELKAAGVNLCVARALVAAGYATGAAVRHASDREILAIRGVGPATLGKLRACYPTGP